MLKQVARFATVGAFATVFHVLVAFAARFGFGLDVQISNFFGFLAAVTFSYFGHARITFEASGSHRIQVPRFVLVAGLGLLLSSAITFIVCTILGGAFSLAMMIVAVANPTATFVASKFWVFSAAKPEARKRD